MAVSAAKTWVASEVLTASDLNAEFSNIYDNGESLAWQATTSKDLASWPLILDADGDTEIFASTDDRIDMKLAGQVLFRFDGTASTPVLPIFFEATGGGTDEVYIKTSGANTSIDFSGKGTGVVQINGETASGTDESQWHISRQVYGR